MRAHQQIRLAREREREGATQARQCGGDRCLRGAAVVHFLCHQMRDHLGVGLARKLCAALLQLLAQLAEVLDDAVVHHRDLVGGVWMGIHLVRKPMRRPARMPDATRAGERFEREALLEILAAPRRGASIVQRRDAGGIVARYSGA